MHKCFSYPLKAGNKERILPAPGPVMSSPAAVQSCATLRSPAPFSASFVKRWASAFTSATKRPRHLQPPPMRLFLLGEADGAGGEGRDGGAAAAVAVAPYLQCLCVLSNIFLILRNLLYCKGHHFAGPFVPYRQHPQITCEKCT